MVKNQKGGLSQDYALNGEGLEKVVVHKYNEKLRPVVVIQVK